VHRFLNGRKIIKFVELSRLKNQKIIIWLIVKVQDIDDPSLTVKMFRTSMTQKIFIAI